MIPVTAAGPTAVEVEPDDQTVTAGDTVTYDIIVQDASDGVGSVDMTVSFTEPSIARIEQADVAGDPNTVRTQPSDDNDGVRVTANGMDTADTGSVRIATVEINGTSGGETGVELDIGSLGDESGQSYTVTGTDGATLTVSAAETTPGPTPTSESGGSASSEVSGSSETATETDTTSTPSPTTTPSPTPTSTSRPGDSTSPTATSGVTDSPSQTDTATETVTRRESGVIPDTIGGNLGISMLGVGVAIGIILLLLAASRGN